MGTSKKRSNDNLYATFLYFISLMYTFFMLYTIGINHLSWNLNIYRANQSFTLIGQFNYPSTFYSEWSGIWSKFTQDIIIATPENITHPNYDTGGKRVFGRFMKYQDDQGFTSPYTNIARIIQENNHSMGYLYIHDDMMFSGSIFEKLGGSDWIMTKDHSLMPNLQVPNHTMYYNVTKNITYSTTTMNKLYKNGTLFSEHAIFYKKWTHWAGCQKAFVGMFDDERLKPFLSRTEDSTDPFLIIKTGQADMLYFHLPSTEQRNAFLGILDLFSEHKLFLECAIPTAVSLMQTMFGFQTHRADLCSVWGSLREKHNKIAPKVYSILVREMIQMCVSRNFSPVHLQKDNFEIIHPIKISKLDNWKQYFYYFHNIPRFSNRDSNSPYFQELKHNQNVFLDQFKENRYEKKKKSKQFLNNFD